MADILYRRVPYRLSELEHRYGPNVHILGHPAQLTMLARLCSPQTRQPEFGRLTRSLYQALATVVADHELPRSFARVRTRMYASSRRGVYEGQIVDPDTRLVVMDIARAGMLPTQACFETFCEIVRPDNVRQDHLFCQRAFRNGRVTGAGITGAKIGGRFGGAILVIPDPMAATGSSLTAVLSHIRSLRLGWPRKIVALHLIITPEYLARVRKEHPDTVVYAVRLDRGLSRGHVLRRIPGELWAEERGLNERQYVVPGGGGFGELLSNTTE